MEKKKKIFSDLLLLQQMTEMNIKENLKVLEKNKINHRIKEVGYHRSLGVIDRFSRTMKTILSKMFTELDSVNWIDHLDKMTTAYNNRPHNGVCGMSPIEAEKYKEDTIRCHLEKIKILHYMISRLVIL